TRTPEQLTTAYTQVLTSLLPDLNSDDLKKQGVAQDTWERIALRAGRPGAEAERLAASKVMLTQVGTAAPQAVRLWMLKQLENIGRAEAVPTLTGLLNDQDPLVKERARRALQNNPAPEAAQALRTALNDATTPEWRVALINALGYRRDAASVNDLSRLLTTNDANVQAAAVAALSKIGGPAALRSLGTLRAQASPQLRQSVADAQLLIAEQLLAQGRKAQAGAIYQSLYAPTETRRNRIAALRGLVAVRGENAVPLLSQVWSGDDAQMSEIASTFIDLVPGTGMTRALDTLLPKLPTAGQATLIGALGNRGDVTAKPVIIRALQSQDDAVRIAALRALSNLGGAADVALLARMAATTIGPESNTARSTLARLQGQDVNDAMVAALNGADPKTRVELIRGLTARRAPKSLPALLKSAGDTDENVRVEAIKSLGTLGDDTTVATLVGLLAKAPSDAQRDAAQQSLKDIIDRSGNKAADAAPILIALPGTQPPVHIALLSLLGKVGGAAALDTVRAATRDTNADVQDAAVHTLADWSDPSAAPELLQMARTADKPNFQIIALRGYVRLANVGNRPAGEKIKMYQDSLDLAKRPDEKKLVLGELANLNSMDALNLVQTYLTDDAVKEEAASAAVRIGKNMGDSVGTDVKPVMEKVIATSKNGDVVKQANEVLNKIKK
ncbi:MAG: HEAT repeat domain-containing protein, partial [Abitibacteriaceae bacterium]|nr:HEAT repeat domain-containing protein [Abditibacteriaceae bacterium]